MRFQSAMRKIASPAAGFAEGLVENRKKTLQNNRSISFGAREVIAAFPFFQRRTVFGIVTGAKFYTLPPPPLKTPLEGWGVFKRGGGVKFLPRVASNHTHPPLLLAKKMGEGGGTSVLPGDKLETFPDSFGLQARGSKEIFSNCLRLVLMVEGFQTSLRSLERP